MDRISKFQRHNGFRTFCESVETFVNKKDAVQYLINKGVQAHVARLFVTHHVKQLSTIGGNNMGNVSINILDEFAHKADVMELNSALYQIKSSKSHVNKEDIYVAGYNKVMDFWSTRNVLNHVYFMKFIEKEENSNIWWYEEIRLNEDFTFNCVVKRKTEFPITSKFSEYHHKVDNFGTLITMAQALYKAIVGGKLKDDEPKGFQKILSFKNNKVEKYEKVLMLVSNYMFNGEGKFQAIRKSFDDLNLQPG